MLRDDLMAAYASRGTLVDTESQNERRSEASLSPRRTRACSSSTPTLRALEHARGSDGGRVEALRRGGRGTFVGSKRVPSGRTVLVLALVENPPAPGRGRGAGARSASAISAGSAIVPAVAVATNEFGLFINGEVVEGSSVRDLVEPATGEALGTAQLAGEAEVDRAVEAARVALGGDWGKTPANERSRLLRSPTRSSEPERALGARGTQRRQGDLLD